MTKLFGANETPVVGVTGWKNSGKTTLVARVVAELTRRGYTVSTVKHAHHAFDVDHEGTDSYKHREAGAVEVALVSGYRWVLMHENRDDEDEPGLADFLPRMAPRDIIVVEGYKREDFPKIEVRRSAARKHDPLALTDPTVIAIASDHPVDETDKPVFDLDAVAEITDFIVQTFALRTIAPEEKDAAQ